MNIRAKTEECRVRLKKLRGHYAELAVEDGLSVSWLSKFASGARNNPTVDTLSALERALERVEAPHEAEEQAA